MDRLSIVLTFMTGSVLVGGLVIAVLALGYYGWLPIAVAAGVGLSLTWPTAYAISRMIKRRDPEWRIRGGRTDGHDPERGKYPET